MRATSHAPAPGYPAAEIRPHARPVPWGELLKRLWDIDGLDCPQCHSRMEVLAVLRDRSEVARYLAHAGEELRAEPSRRARAPPSEAA